MSETNSNRKAWPPSLQDDDTSRGLECRECGCRHFYVDHTRKAHRMIIRYRRCRHCGRRVTTCERVMSTDQ